MKKTPEILRRIATVAALVLVIQSSPIHAQTSAWPAYMPTLQPARSMSPMAAKLPANVSIEAPSPDLPSKIAAWSGKWSGWTGRNQVGDLRLAVETVSAEGATLVYGFADSRTTEPFIVRVPAKFVGDELQATLPGNGALIVFRMRDPRVVEFRYDNGEQKSFGVMAKE